MDNFTALERKIDSKKARVVIVGIGYVGLPIAIELCKKGYIVTGLDRNRKRVERLNTGISYIKDVPVGEIRSALRKKTLSATSDETVMSQADIIIMCVPTPLKKIKTPDMSYIVKATRSLCRNMKKGQLVIIESTTYPGTTREIILPEMEKSGSRVDKDFFLAFSPERIDPGNPDYGLKDIPKIVGGVTERSTRLAEKFYSKIIKKVIAVASAETAEVTKLLENTFRLVNIGFINEFSMLCGELGIDVWEVIEAAKTKPFGFMPFYPGPGIGGHCIPADPMYLSWKARKVGVKTQMIDLAAKINRSRPVYVVERAARILKDSGRTMRGAKILILGVTYKKDIKDLRDSPALEIIRELKKKKAKVAYHDPFLPYLDIKGIKMDPTPLTASALGKTDLVIAVTDHSGLDYRAIARNSSRILDTRDVFDKNSVRSKKVFKL